MKVEAADSDLAVIEGVSRPPLPIVLGYECAWRVRMSHSLGRMRGLSSNSPRAVANASTVWGSVAFFALGALIRVAIGVAFGVMLLI